MENKFKDDMYELDNIFFEDINEWDNFCDELDLTEVNNMLCLNKGGNKNDS